MCFMGLPIQQQHHIHRLLHGLCVCRFFSFDFIATSWECIFTTQTTIYKTEADTPTRSKGKTNWATYENYNYIHSFNLWTCNIYWHSVLVFIFRNISTWSFQCVLNIGIMGKTWGERFQVVLRASNLFWFPLSNFDWVKISTMELLAPQKKANHFGLQCIPTKFSKIHICIASTCRGVVWGVQCALASKCRNKCICTEVLLLIQRKLHV